MATAIRSIDTSRVREVLQEMHAQLSAEHDAANEGVVEFGPRADSDGDDAVDVGAKMAQREQQLTLQQSIRDRLDQVELALRRLAEGRYGECDNCGKPISAERLAAFPAATTCIDCKRADERRG